MINFKRADHIHICVPHDRLEEARLFYTNIIGLQLMERPDVFSSTGYWFRVADIELHIGVEDGLPRSIRHTAMEVSDIAAARKHLKIMMLKLWRNP